MRLPISHPFSTSRRNSATTALGSLLCFLAAAAICTRSLAQQANDPYLERVRMHETEQWRVIESHLPDLSTSSAQTLETQADILRARRFPEDAMDYYKAAIARGGSAPSLFNKLGLTELEMRNIALARGFFQRALKANKKNADAWNNLGAVDYMDGRASASIFDYKRAIKLDKRDAVFHANLATTYFEQKDYKGARREMAAALKIDPHIFEHEAGSGGIAAHVLSSEDRARFALEMAKLYARNGLEADMMHALAMASEAGMDIQVEMHKDPYLVKFEADPRVEVMVHNADALHARRGNTASAAGAAPALPRAKSIAN